MCGPHTLEHSKMKRHILLAVDQILAMMKDAKVSQSLMPILDFEKCPSQWSHSRTFITPFARFQFNRLPFGIALAQNVTDAGGLWRCDLSCWWCSGSCYEGRDTCENTFTESRCSTMFAWRPLVLFKVQGLSKRGSMVARYLSTDSSDGGKLWNIPKTKITEPWTSNVKPCSWTSLAEGLWLIYLSGQRNSTFSLLISFLDRLR